MTMMEHLKRDEGRRTRPYQDSLGHWTVGYGHNLESGDLSEDAITTILRDDLLHAETQCLQLPWWRHLSGPRKGVLVNMAFNMGYGGLLTFRKFLQACAEGCWDVAATEMLDSTWAKQVGARATRLARQMRDDVWV